MQMFVRGSWLNPLDMKLLWRDRFGGFLIGFTLCIGVILRFLLPWLDRYTQEQQILPNERVSQTLEQMYPLFMAYFGIYNAALLVGTVFGFMFIDERDNKTLTAIAVTPMPLTIYIRQKSLLATMLAFVLILMQVVLIGQALPSWPVMIVIALVGSLTAPTIALFLASFAADKVQGFALTKFTALFGALIPVAWFIGTPWRFVAGLFPPCLVSHLYWSALSGGSWWLWCVLAGGCHLLVYGVLEFAFRRKA